MLNSNTMEKIVLLVLSSIVCSISCSPTPPTNTAVENRAPRPPKTVCYLDIGCFSTNGTFASIVALLPDSPEDIGTTFKLFTKHNINAGQVFDYRLPDTLTTAYLDSTRDTVILIHGFAITEDPNDWFLKHAFLKHTESQVIVVDWRKGSQAPTYWTATANSELVGRQVAELIRALVNERDVQPEKIHIVGSSLGAHVAGFAGKWVRDQHGYLIGRISGNDPAGPYFQDLTESAHLSPKDARFVDIIHTNAGTDIMSGESGILKAIGHVDFYPNGGNLQPGCVKGHPTCSHMRADNLYADSLNFPNCRFKSFPCPGGFSDYQKGLCRVCTNGCGELGIAALTAAGRGVQYLETNDKTPFCKS